MTNIFVVGNKVSIPPENRLNNHTTTDLIIFIGKMNYDPNVIAVTYFATNIFPKLKAVFPKLQFFIIGAYPPYKVKKLQSIDGITVTGFVDSIEPYLQNATIVVAPMLTGAGIQNKIIQAMSYRCCVATTPIGAEGINLAYDPCIIFNNTQEWISGLIDLLQNRDKRIKLGFNARFYVEKELSDKTIAMQFWNFINAPFTS